MSYEYRGVSCLKSPIDIAIYLRLVWNIKPRTIIEIGSKDGGSALLFSDILKMYDLDCKIYSIDITPVKSENLDITFLKGDVNDLNETFGDPILQNLPHPIIVIEDSAHSYEGCSSALNFFAKKLIKNDYLIIEDGILEDLGWSGKYDGGPNRALKEFFAEYPDTFEVDLSYCDMFGKNATYNPNGYLRKL